MANKVKYGLKNLHIFPIKEQTSETTTYDGVIKVAGAVSLSLKASGDSNEFYADDTVFWSEFSNNGYEGDLEIALIPEEFEIKILGQLIDKNGAVVESSNDKASNYAMAFEFSGDKTQTRHILYNCSSSRPDVESETVKDKKEPNPDKLTIKAMPALDTGYVKAKLEKGKTGYDTFFSAPYKVVLPEGITPTTGGN